MMEMLLSEQLVARKVPEGSSCTWGKEQGDRRAPRRALSPLIPSWGAAREFLGTTGGIRGREHPGGSVPGLAFSREPSSACEPL